MLNSINTPETIQVGFKVAASFCILVRAPFIEFLEKLVGCCAYDIVTILKASAADIIVTANVRPVILIRIFITNS